MQYKLKNNLSYIYLNKAIKRLLNSFIWAKNSKNISIILLNDIYNNTGEEIMHLQDFLKNINYKHCSYYKIRDKKILKNYLRIQKNKNFIYEEKLKPLENIIKVKRQQIMEQFNEIKRTSRRCGKAR